MHHHRVHCIDSIQKLLLVWTAIQLDVGRFVFLARHFGHVLFYFLILLAAGPGVRTGACRLGLVGGGRLGDARMTLVRSRAYAGG